jgi:hypothetical protein
MIGRLFRGQKSPIGFARKIGGQDPAINIDLESKGAAVKGSQQITRNCGLLEGYETRSEARTSIAGQ